MKRLLIFFFLIGGITASAQFSKQYDTVFYTAGGYDFFYRSAVDTVFINDDTIYIVDYIYTSDTLFINDDTIPIPVTYYANSGDTTFINEDTLIALAGQGRIMFDTTTLSIVQVDALHTDSIVLIVAPGADKYINVINAIVQVDSDGTPNIGAGTLDMTYNTAAGGGYAATDIIRQLAGVYFNSASLTQWHFPNAPDITASNTLLIANVSVVLWLTDANIGDDTRLKIYITYQILDY